MDEEQSMNVDMDYLLFYLGQPQKAQSLHCQKSHDLKPERRPHNQFYLTGMEWIHHKFPLHCKNESFYITDYSTAKHLFNTFKSEAGKNYVWFENVYVTGILRESANVSFVPLNQSLWQSEHEY